MCSNRHRAIPLATGLAAMLPIAVATKRFYGAGVLPCACVRWIAEHAAASARQRARMRDCRRCTSASICLLGGCDPLFTDLVLFHRQDLYVALTGCRGRKTFLQRLDSDFGACQTPELRSQLAQSFHHVKLGKWAPGPRSYKVPKSAWAVTVSLREALQGTKAIWAGFARDSSIEDIQERVCALVGRAPGAVALIVCGRLYEHPSDQPFESCGARAVALVVVAQTAADEMPRARVCVV